MPLQARKSSPSRCNGEVSLAWPSRRIVRGSSPGLGGNRFIRQGSSWGELKVWDAVTGQETLTLRGHEDRVSSVAFSPDGQRIVSGSSDNSVKVWAASGQEAVILI